MDFRSASLSELALVLDWAKAEGWNPGLEDVAAFYSADPGGFFVAVEDDQPVASISIVNHSDRFAFLGLYICTPEFRGRGIGFELWQHGLMHAGNRTVGLDGVAEQQGNYRKSGFELSGTTQRYEGLIEGRGQNAIRAFSKLDTWVHDLDSSATGVDRQEFLNTWIEQKETRSTLVSADRDGFVTVRKCQSGVKIGPLTATTRKIAIDLLHAAAAIFPGEDCIIDVPQEQQELAEYRAILGMNVTFATARMYKGKPPAPNQLIHAVATLELG